MTNPTFATVVIPYDGSEPSKAALEAALALGLVGPSSIAITVVDETAFIAQTATVALAYDPTPLLAALDTQGEVVLADAARACAAAGITLKTELIHDSPVRGILDATDRHRGDLIVMGTHARTGMSRAFVGSTTEGVLRLTHVPLLSFRASVSRATVRGPILVAVDDAEPADRAVALAAKMVPGMNVPAVLINVLDVEHAYESVAPYGFDPMPVLNEARENGRRLLDRAAARIAEHGTVGETGVVEGRPANAILAKADAIGASMIVIGSHGRRGLQRMFLGSVAEDVLRRSPIGVLVAR